MPGILTALVTAFVLLVGWAVWQYNRLVRLRNQVKEGWSGIEVQLKRRHELVPALVATVKGYQAHEEEVLEEVTRERSAAEAAQGPAEAGAAERDLGRGIGRLVALAEHYPDLKADAAFRQLMRDLVDTEDQIQFARRYYNGSVRDFNNAAEAFPGNLVAGAFAFRPAEFFEVDNAAERLPPDLVIR